MKKLFTLLALVLGMVSCQNEPEALDVVVGGEQEVMLNVSLPESTRANSADGFDFDNLGDYKVRYILEISYKGNLIRDFKITDTTTTKFPVRLAPNRDYTFTVWADLVTETEVQNWYDADLYYNTEGGLDEIEVITENWIPNTEARDAWTATKTVTYTSSNKNIGLELKRPFAKVCVVATDIADVRKFGIVPTAAVAEYTASEMYTEFDAVAGTVKGETTGKTHTFNYADVDAYEDANSEQFTVFADYVFVPTDGNVQFSLSIYADAQRNDLIKTNNFNTTIQVVANKVTSIVGNVLTEGGDVSIKIENELGEKETIKYVDTIATLQDAINTAEDGVVTTIRLGGDIAIDDVTTRAEAQYGLVIPATKVIVLDLNGKTISQSKIQFSKYAMLENNGTLTICNSANTNGTISYGDNAPLSKDVNYTSNTIQNNGVLTINEGVTLLNTSIAKVAKYGYPHVIDTNGTLTINGGILTNSNYSTMRIWTSNTDPTKCSVVINGGEFNGCIDFQAHSNNNSTIPHYGTLFVNGGTFNADAFTNSAIRVLRFASNANDMHAIIKGGYFNGKVWVRNIGTFESTPKIINITGGTFTTSAKEGSYDALADGYNFFEDGNGNWIVKSAGYYTDASGNYHITGANGWLWMADQNDNFFRNKTIYLDNDIDFTGVDMRVTRMSTPEYTATFDGQGHTVSNIWMASNYQYDNQALFDGSMNVRNLTVTNTKVFGQSRVGIIGANIYGTIENCHVKKSRAYGYVWQVGGIVGLHSWGEIKNCSVEDTNIECYYYGAVGAIAGCMNEVSRNITNCTVKNCQLIKEGTYPQYSDYDSLFGAFAGYLLASGTYTFSGSVENTTTKVNGVTTDAVVYGEAESSIVTFNGVQL